ncbi:GntR family transcriptional regulator [Sporosarcina psychrophila]|nr:GntR family transcriptional regulator [Sporosarcina psychrophila]AMQ07879.1 GntR family transcriptional regulator [Sporosarcina psychrophila]
MLNLTEKLDKSVPIPLYFQLKELVQKKIEIGIYQVGDSIPTEKELSEVYEISRTTVRQAITELVQEGLLYREKSKGTFVRAPKISQSFAQALGSFNDQIRDLGMTPTTEVLNLEVVEASKEVIEHLKLQPNEKVIYIHRRRFADNEPIVMVKTYLPYEKCKNVLKHNFVEESLYPVLSMNKETKINKIKRFIEAVEAIEYDMENLHLEKGRAVQKFISIGFNIKDEPIEYTIARYRGDKNRFEIVISATK